MEHERDATGEKPRGRACRTRSVVVDGPSSPGDTAADAGSELSAAELG